jgi:hypothetical protein
MFSIARYTGEEDQEKDSRSLEKKQERLNKLNARIGNKKRKDDTLDSSSGNTEKKVKTVEEPIEKKKQIKDSKNTETIEKAAKEIVEETAEEIVEDVEKDEKVIMETEAMEIVPVVEDKDIPTLEAFPDMLGPKSKHSKEEVKLLKSMGIPEWLLQPTVVSPKDSCGLDKAGLSSHLIERCQDLGLSSLFAGICVQNHLI